MNIKSSEKRDVARENLLLAALPKREYQRIQSKMMRLTLSLKQKLFEPNEPLEHVYFPISGVVSLITIMKDGTRTEVATIGNEGLVGLPVFLGAKSIPAEAFSQIPGDAMQMTVKAFREELQSDGQLRDILNLYAQALLDQISQSVSCNRVHNAPQRMCRWLLMCHDRIGADTFPLTQEFLGQMLGVRRATVCEVAARLQKTGSIRYKRGIVTVVNRKKLIDQSCECYQIVKDEFDRLLGNARPL